MSTPAKLPVLPRIVLSKRLRGVPAEPTAAASHEVDTMVEQARAQADAQRAQAEQDVSLVHEQGRARATEREEEARRKVEDLARQRDTIAAQLQSLRETLSAAVGPLCVVDPPAEH